MSLLMRLVQSRKYTFLFKDLFLFICDLSHDLRKLIHLWSHVDRNFSRISICSMGMWQPGTSWSSVISLLSSADWAWLMKSTPEGPSRLLASYLSSGSPQNGFCWDQLASKETCMVCSCPALWISSFLDPGVLQLMNMTESTVNYVSTWNVYWEVRLSSRNACYVAELILGICLQSFLVPLEVFPLC